MITPRLDPDHNHVLSLEINTKPTQQHYSNLVYKSGVEEAGAPTALTPESTRSGPERGFCRSAVQCLLTQGEGLKLLYS